MKENDKLVSIIIPVFNTKKYLKQCMDSVLNQKYRNIQVIVVDDGSTDGSEIICDNYAEMDDRIEVLHINNAGSVGARKEALKVARGEYIGFVDSDDYIDSDMFSSLVVLMEKTGADFVHSGYKEVKDNYLKECINFDKAIYDLTNDKSKISFLTTFLLDIKSGKTISYSIWSKLFRAELIKKCFGMLDNRQQFGEDAICLFKCIFESHRVVFEPVAFYNYRIREESLSHLETEVFFNRQVMMCGEILRTLEDYDCLSSLKREINGFLVSSLFTVKKNEKNRPYKLTQYYLEDIELFRGKSVAIYGAGNVGEDLCEQLMAENIDVQCVVDANPRSEKINGVKIETPSYLFQKAYDYILIAVFSETLASEIREQLIRMGMVNKSIIWIKPKRYF